MPRSIVLGLAVFVACRSGDSAPTRKLDRGAYCNKVDHVFASLDLVLHRVRSDLQMSSPAPVACRGAGAAMSGTIRGFIDGVDLPEALAASELLDTLHDLDGQLQDAFGGPCVEKLDAAIEAATSALKAARGRITQCPVR